MDGSVLEEKSSFKMLELTFSSTMDWDSYIISIAETAPKKIGALICSVKFLSPQFVMHLYQSTMCPCIEYCCHVWVSAPNCYLELLDKPPKLICGTVGPSTATSLEHLAHWRNVLYWYYKYYFGRYPSKTVQLVPLSYFRGDLLVIR